MIVKTESYYGITLMVDDDFDEDYDSLVLKKVLKGFINEFRRLIFAERDEIDMINERKNIKFEPEYYLNKDGLVKSLPI